MWIDDRLCIIVSYVQYHNYYIINKLHLHCFSFYKNVMLDFFVPVIYVSNTIIMYAYSIQYISVAALTLHLSPSMLLIE